MSLLFHGDMDIRPIKSEADYEAVLERIRALMDAKPESDAGDEFDVLTTLAEAYEARHFPIEPADPVEAILFRMEQQGLTRKDLDERDHADCRADLHAI